MAEAGFCRGFIPDLFCRYAEASFDTAMGSRVPAREEASKLRPKLPDRRYLSDNRQVIRYLLWEATLYTAVSEFIKENQMSAISNPAAKANHFSTRKVVLTGMFACLAFVLNTFVYFPAMAPFQHFVDVLAAVFIGPFYGFISALLCGLMRMASGRTIQAVTGAVFGPVIGGILYKKTGNIYLVWLGEVIGTGFCGAMASYPLMKLFYGLDAQSPFYYIPFYIPAAVVGASMGIMVLLLLKKNGLLEKLMAEVR